MREIRKMGRCNQGTPYRRQEQTGRSGVYVKYVMEGDYVTKHNSLPLYAHPAAAHCNQSTDRRAIEQHCRCIGRGSLYMGRGTHGAGMRVRTNTAAMIPKASRSSTQPDPAQPSPTQPASLPTPGRPPTPLSSRRWPFGPLELPASILDLPLLTRIAHLPLFQAPSTSRSRRRHASQR